MVEACWWDAIVANLQRQKTCSSCNLLNKEPKAQMGLVVQLVPGPSPCFMFSSFIPLSPEGFHRNAFHTPEGSQGMGSTEVPNLIAKDSP